jgi:predicted nucleic acid-binding protein
MIYLLDTNVFIHAHKHDFPPSDPGRFWDLIVEMSRKGFVKVPDKVFEELGKVSDVIFEWITANKHSLHLDTTDALPFISDVLSSYGDTLTELDLQHLENNADPFLIAHAIHLNGIVVTDEHSNSNIVSPRKKKIPDICKTLSVLCLSYPRFLWEISPR